MDSFGRKHLVGGELARIIDLPIVHADEEAAEDKAGDQQQGKQF